MARSLRLREQCIPILKSSLLRHGFPSQKILAEELGISQSTVSSFLNGKPVDYLNFVELCRVLSQEWRDIADLDDKSNSEAVPTVKVKVLIRDCHQCTSLTTQLQHALSYAGHHVLLTQDGNPLTETLPLS
ncbi:MAG TPA: molecular chaperone Tir, partial [Coleofasciculaceae cyanobacterium]